MSEAKLVQNVDFRSPRISLVGTFGGNVGGTDLDLRGADLSYVDLRGADLREAFLSGAKLSGVFLNFADLSDAEGITDEELVQQAGSVAGTTMPDTSTKAGRHYTYAFEPLLSFSVGSDGWRLSGPEIVGDLRVANEQGQIIFSSTPAAVFDPSTPSEPKELPPPENADEWVSWFQNHPRLDTSKPAPVSVDGVSGAQLDVTAVSTPENFSRDYCGRWSCVPLFRYGEPGESQLNMSYADSKDRFIIMDIEGKTVIIDVYASEADAFRRFAPEAQKVLDTVKWEEGP